MIIDHWSEHFKLLCTGLGRYEDEAGKKNSIIQIKKAGLFSSAFYLAFVIFKSTNGQFELFFSGVFALFNCRYLINPSLMPAAVKFCRQPAFNYLAKRGTFDKITA